VNSNKIYVLIIVMFERY